MGTFPEMWIVRHQYMNIKSQTRMRKQNTDVIQLYPIRQRTIRLLSKQLAKECVNLIFKKLKMDRRKNGCYQVPCLNCPIRYIGETSQWWDERESQHKRSVKNREESNSFYVHLRECPDHMLGWEKVSFLAFDS